MIDSGLTGYGVLIVEDEALLRKQIAAHLERLGADVTVAPTLEAASNLVKDLDFDLALLDVNLPDGKSTTLLEEKAFSKHTAVVVMTADSGVAGAVEAMRLGAMDYLAKPFEVEELPLVINRVRRARQSARVDEYQQAKSKWTGNEFFFGNSLRDLEARLTKILEADARMGQHLPPVLIHGETGTGKTTIARFLHQNGPRAKQPLVEMNCSALPETLAESELFGHERGAFTDAKTARMGMFEAANGGTLFLDELPSLSLGLQAKVLKALEDHRIRRLGGNKEIPVDVRVIAATNADLHDLVAKQEFREDLFHRLDLYRLAIPPLRERKEDIVPLAEMLLTRLCRRHRLKKKSITAKGKERLRGSRWAGNVRELAHEIERAIVFEESNPIEFLHLESGTAGPGGSASQDDWLNTGYVFPPEGFKLDDAMNRLIQLALTQTNQNVSAAARLLGVSRDVLRYRLSGQKSEDSTNGE